MNTPQRGPVMKILEQILPKMKYPYLFLLLGGLFVVDLVIPDPIPFVDEAMLLLLTMLVGSWGRREPAPPKEQPSSQPKDVTDRGDDY